jgi:hypothetical protein
MPGPRSERANEANAGLEEGTMCRAGLGEHVILAVIVIGLFGSAHAGEVAVLAVDYGGDVSPLLERAVARAVATSSGREPLEAGVAAARVAERYRGPAGVDEGWVDAEVERGEELYYAMAYGDAAAVFEAPAWRDLQSAVVDMALEPNLAVAVRRGLMARVRARFYSGDAEATEAAIREAVVLFPEWLPETDWYQPEVIVRYAEVRHDVLRGAGELEVSAPAGNCDFSVNGLPLGRGSVASATIAGPWMAVRVSCGGRASRVHCLAQGSAWVDPRFDEGFDPVRHRLVLSREAAGDAELLAAMGRAYADVAGVEGVILAGVLPSGELQLVSVRAHDDTPHSAVRAHPSRDGTLDVPTAVTALLGGTPSTSVSVASVEDRRLVFTALHRTSEAPRSGPGAATWVAFGVGGAGLILGTVFAIVESGAWEELEACDAERACFAGPEGVSLQDDRDSAALLATIGFGVAIAGVITGVVLWLVQSGEPRAPADGTVARPSTPAWRPDVGASFTGEGGGVELLWRF